MPDSLQLVIGAGLEVGDATGGQSAGATTGPRFDGLVAGRQQTPLTIFWMRTVKMWERACSR